ncbi:CHAT domain-containing protein [Acidobacteriota bacterium]
MAPTLRLTLTDFEDLSHWRWVLSDVDGRFLADHDVRLDTSCREYNGLQKLDEYLDYYEPIQAQEQQLTELGDWIGEQIFGNLRDTFWQHRSLPAIAVHVIVPEEAQDLLFQPFELARFEDGTYFWRAGLRFIYQLESAATLEVAKEPVGSTFRILTVFSLPESTNPLNLRRERYELQSLARELNQTRGVAIELRVLQFGATRNSFREALEEAEGWDVVHLSGHGLHGELLLEDERGDSDCINANELGDMLGICHNRLKLVLLDSCYSGAAYHAIARVQIGLDKLPVRHDAGEAKTVILPSLAQSIAQSRDCAVLAMRFPVGDAFATELMLSLYEKLISRRQALPAALHLALEHALAADIPHPPLSLTTPVLFGPRAADLKLIPPERPALFTLPETGLSIAFPPEPIRFVGRSQPMQRASQAFAPRSDKLGVLFYGMPGAGKTACALELSYRHDRGRFRGYVWYQAPEVNKDITAELFNFLFEVERQLNTPKLGLTSTLKSPEHFRNFTLPRLQALLNENSLLLVLDNLETMLTDDNQWRDPMWSELIATLLGHRGPSRVVLTSQRQPKDLVDHPRLQGEAIHSLRFANSVLLARELPNLKRLFHDAAGLDLLKKILRLVQGHPKLLELADSLAIDRQALSERLTKVEDGLENNGDLLDAFLAVADKDEGETRQTDAEFVNTLHLWTNDAIRKISDVPALLLKFLCRLESEDRLIGVIWMTWRIFLQRLAEEHPDSATELADPDKELALALIVLHREGLVSAQRPEVMTKFIDAMIKSMEKRDANNEPPDPTTKISLLSNLVSDEKAILTIHPIVVEAVSSETGNDVLVPIDITLGNFHLSAFDESRKIEMHGSGNLIRLSARRAIPYLLRQARWEIASDVLEHLLHREQDQTLLAYVIPFLRQIAEASRGTDQEIGSTLTLAKALRFSDCKTEAKELLNSVILLCVKHGNFRLAFNASVQLANILITKDSLSEALRISEVGIRFAQQASLGPWTQLSAEGLRLQILNLMGFHDEVLHTIESLRTQMSNFSEELGTDELVLHWNVKEGILNAAQIAALENGNFKMALGFAEELIESVRSRGASEHWLAVARFNSYGPLLRLQRYDEVRKMLTECRVVFEASHDIQMLGKLYGALADLEESTGELETAIQFEEKAMFYHYQTNIPSDCASSHANYCYYLIHNKSDQGIILAHEMACAIIYYQIGSIKLHSSIQSIASNKLPDTLPTYEDVVAKVEAISGVNFTSLFETLPRRAPDGDAAISTIWELVTEEKERIKVQAKMREDVLSTLPPTVKASFELDRDKFPEAFRTAMEELLDGEAKAVEEKLIDAGLIKFPRRLDITKLLRDFDPLIKEIVKIAQGDKSKRKQIEEELLRGEQYGWKLTDVVHRIWDGERDPVSLTAMLDKRERAIILQILKLLTTRSE